MEKPRMTQDAFWLVDCLAFRQFHGHIQSLGAGLSIGCISFGDGYGRLIVTISPGNAENRRLPLVEPLGISQGRPHPRKMIAWNLTESIQYWSALSRCELGRFHLLSPKEKGPSHNDSAL
jgi:hypothetical protein